jgi:hypothetical protein
MEMAGFCLKSLRLIRNTKRCFTKIQFAYDIEKAVCARFVERKNNLSMRLHEMCVLVNLFNPFSYSLYGTSWHNSGI